MSAAIAGDDCAALRAGGTCESMCAGRRMARAFRVLYWSRRGRHLRRIRSPRFEDIASCSAIDPIEAKHMPDEARRNRLRRRNGV